MSFHPLLRMRARELAAQQLAKDKGIRLFAALRQVRSIDENEMNVAMTQATEESGMMPPGTGNMVGAIGDGTIIQAIIDWLKSDEGKAFIQALIKIILSLLVAV